MFCHKTLINLCWLYMTNPSPILPHTQQSWIYLIEWPQVKAIHWCLKSTFIIENVHCCASQYLLFPTSTMSYNIETQSSLLRQLRDLYSRKCDCLVEFWLRTKWLFLRLILTPWRNQLTTMIQTHLNWN